MNIVNDFNKNIFLFPGEVASGLPEFSLPPFYTQLGNQSYNFGEMVEALGTSIVLVPIIAVLGNVAIAKAFGNKKVLYIFIFIVLTFYISAKLNLILSQNPQSCNYKFLFIPY